MSLYSENDIENAERTAYNKGKLEALKSVLCKWLELATDEETKDYSELCLETWINDEIDKLEELEAK